jgi:hypothetical protein
LLGGCSRSNFCNASTIITTEYDHEYDSMCVHQRRARIPALLFVTQQSLLCRCNSVGDSVRLRVVLMAAAGGRYDLALAHLCCLALAELL